MPLSLVFLQNYSLIHFAKMLLLMLRSHSLKDLRSLYIFYKYCILNNDAGTNVWAIST